MACALRAGAAILSLLFGACGGPPGAGDPAGAPGSVIGSRGRLPGHFSSPRGIDVHSDGRMAVADRTGRIQLLAPGGEPLREWKLPAFRNGTPTGILFDTTLPGQHTLIVADTHYNRILRYSLDGRLIHQFGEYGETRDKMVYPTDVALDPEGRLYVAEYGLHDRVLRFSPDGEKLGEWGGFGTEPGQFQRPLGIVWAPPGRIIVADTCNHRLQVFTPDGDLIAVWGRFGEAPGEFRYPYDLCVDDEGRVLVCEYGNNRIQYLDAKGETLALYGKPGRNPGEFATPWGIARALDGTVVVADTDNHRLQVLAVASILEDSSGPGKTVASSQSIAPPPTPSAATSGP